MINTPKKFELKNPKQLGFTLIELLIVIVIIGILAGVVIGVINPIQQQNRAKDAAARSAISKMALSTKSLFVSSPRSTNRAPTLMEFSNGVGGYNKVGITANLCDDDASTDNSPTTSAFCLFNVEGLSTPSDCATNGYNGEVASGSACHFVYFRSGDVFNIGVRGAAKPAVMFVYTYRELAGASNIQEGFYSCPVDFDITATPVGTCAPLN